MIFHRDYDVSKLKAVFAKKSQDNKKIADLLIETLKSLFQWSAGWDQL